MTDDQRQATGRLALAVIEDGMVAYASHPVARAVITVIPFGSFFDALVGTAGSNLALERLQVLVDELRQAIDRVPAEKQDLGVTEEQLLAAALRAVRAATETANREKVQTIAAALVGATSADRPLDLDIETVIASLAGLTAADLGAARRLAESLGINGGVSPSVLGPDGEFFSGRLAAAGLLESVVIPGNSTLRNRGMRNTDPSIEFRLSPTFARILDLLRAGGITTFVPTGSTGSYAEGTPGESTL